MSTTATIVVIGGGPAGSTTATLLAQRGFDVKLFEAESFPRPHVGESLLPSTLAILELSGVLPKIQAEGFVVKGGASMIWGSNDELWSWYFSETNVRFPTSFQVSRPRFDQILLEHARECGVEVHESTRVNSIVFEDTWITGVRLSNGFVPARFVVDATGQSALLATQMKLRVWDEYFRNLAVFGYFRGGKHLTGRASGNILIESVKSGWLWKIPLQNNVSSVGVVTDRDIALNEIRETNTRDWYLGCLAQSALVGSLLRNAQLDDEPQAVRDWSYKAENFAGRNHCLVGDAACFVDPLFSTGVHLAVSAAHLAAAYVATSIREPSLADRARHVFERIYRQQYEHFHELARLFYSGNRSVGSYFWESRTISGETDLAPRAAFVRAVSGQAAAGYERSVLARAVLPETFLDELNHIEGVRRVAFEHVSVNDVMTLPLVMNQTIGVSKDVILGESQFEEGFVIRGPGRVDLPVDQFVAVFLERLKGCRTAAEVLEEMVHDGFPRTTTRKAIQETTRLLILDGVLYTTE